MASMILVVEDELVPLFDQIFALAEGRYEVKSAETGYEAIRKARMYRPTLIVMDLKLPQMDGIEAIRRIREFDSKVPILAITAYPDHYSKKRAMAAGASAFLNKPFNVPELLETIGRLLESSP
jgi:two-component system chemotaxis response regulator CheY